MSPVPDRSALAVRAHTADPVELWLIRLRPGARARYLALLEAFLEHGGHTVSSAIEAAREDRHATFELVKVFIASLPDVRAEREFAYSALQSFFTRSRIYLPTDPGYAVGGCRERWWLGADA
jgi:hypothetical protein